MRVQDGEILDAEKCHLVLGKLMLRLWERRKDTRLEPITIEMSVNMTR
jgi:hypothetical protein